MLFLSMVVTLIHLYGDFKDNMAEELALIEEQERNRKDHEGLDKDTASTKSTIASDTNSHGDNGQNKDDIANLNDFYADVDFDGAMGPDLSRLDYHNPESENEHSHVNISSADIDILVDNSDSKSKSKPVTADVHISADNDFTSSSLRNRTGNGK